MHYPGLYDKESGQYDLITLPRFYQETIGHMEGLSFKDTALINRIFCNDTCKEKNWCLNNGYLNPNDCSKCLCPDGFAGTDCRLLEFNLNCEDTSGTLRELQAKRTNKVLKPRIKCNGARLCCPGALHDAARNAYKNWIEAEEPNVDFIISTHISADLAKPTTLFELNYEAGTVKLTNSNDCVHPDNLYRKKRNPGTKLKCVDKFEKPVDCLCHGKAECLSQEKWREDRWRCPVFVINGQIRKIMSIKDYNARPYVWVAILYCFRPEGASKSFWGYRENATAEPIRVDEIQCLGWKQAGVKPKFKSLGAEHHQFNQSAQTINATS
uniref:Peptidase M12A domain-containing protein n=1 Tax=Globodera pallida TaxID=36090 RepID=A0A183C852_GLOPA